MIVITGPGRSGTTLVAQAYRAAGADPGGDYHGEVRAGLEDRAVAEMNIAILSALGSSMLGVVRRPPRISDLPPDSARARWAGRLSPETRQRIRAAYIGLPWNRATSFTPPDWSRTEDAVSQLGARMREIAADRVIVKDPQFSLTLPVWLRAGVVPSHVVVTTRDVDAMMRSRSAAQHLGYRQSQDARNALLLSIGTLMATLWDHPEMPSTVLRFPDFLGDLEQACDLLPLPAPMTRAELLEALRGVVDPSMVTGGSGVGPGTGH